ncbi:hypothetical protein D9M73_160740 [compost metagenome]
MGGQAVELFGDIALLRQQDHFLFQTLRVEFRLHFGETVENLLPLVAEHFRNQRAQVGHFIDDRRQALVDDLRQFGAFAGAAGLQFIQRLVECGQCLRIEGLRIGGIGHQHARPGQHGERVERCGLLDQGGHALGGSDQLCGAFTVDLQRLAGVVLDETQGALHLAARQALAQRFAHAAFEIAEGFRQTQVRFQIAVIDRAQLPAQGAIGTGPFHAGECGHAVHHGATSLNNLEKREA